MQPVSQTTASKYVSKLGADAAERRLPDFVASELKEASNLFTCQEKQERMLVAFIGDKDQSEPDYVMMYRKTQSTPAVYTVDALLANAVNEARMPIHIVERMLRVFCLKNRIHLQTYPLRTWCGGRYASALKLEKILHFNE